MATKIRVTAEDAADLLNAGMYGAGALIHIQSSTTETGTFADLSGTGSTPTIALVSGTASYTGYDPAGTSSMWYRVRYKSSDGNRTSDWLAAFQVGAEEGGLICSLEDVRQSLGPTIADSADDEIILDDIRAVTRWLEGPAGVNRWIVPRPTDPASTTTYRFHTRNDRTLWLPNGIRSITTLGVATEDQPSSGGTYTTATSTDYYIDPPDAERTVGWPGNRIVFRRTAAGSVVNFYDASFGAEIVGKFGFAEVPPDLSRIGVTLAVAYHREAGSSGGDSFTITLNGDRVFERALSHRDRLTLSAYRHLVAA